MNPPRTEPLPQTITPAQPGLDYQANLKKVTKGTGIGGFGELGYTALAYLINVVIARFLGAEGVGIYAQALTIMTIATTLARLGFDAGVLKFTSQYLARKDFRRITGLDNFTFRLVTIVSLLTGALLFIKADLIANAWLDEPQLVFVLKVFALTTPFTALTSIWLNGLQAFHRIDYQVYLGRLARPFITLSFISLFLFVGWRWPGVVWGTLISTVILATLTWYTYTSVKKAHMGLERPEPYLETTQWLRFSTPLLLSSLLAFTVTRVTTLILGSFLSSAEVGIYDVALKISLLIQLPLVASNTVLAPIIGEAYSIGDFEKLAALLKTSTKWVFTLGFFAFLEAVLFAKPILGIFGGEFVVGISLLIILGLGQMANIGTGGVAWVLIMAGYSMIHMFNAIFSAVQVILLSYWLIPKYGTMGAALAVALTMTTVNILRLIQVFYLLRIHPYRWDFIKPVVAGLAVFGVISQLQPGVAAWISSEIVATVLLGTISVLLFAAILVLLKFREEEKELGAVFFQKLKIGRNFEGR